MGRPKKGNELQVTAFDKTKTCKEWSKEFNVPPKVIRNRIEKNWEPERAVSEPPRLSPAERARRRRRALQKYL